MLKPTDHGRAGPDSRWTGGRGMLLLLAGFMTATICGLLVLGSGEFSETLILQIGLVFGFFLMLFLFQRPQIGLALLLVGGILITREIGTGTQTTLNGAFLLSPLLVVLWLIHLIYDPKGNRLSSRPVLPLCLFMAAVTLAFGVGQYPWFPAEHAPITAQLVQLAIFLFSCGLLLAASCQLQSPVWLERITFLFIILGSFHLLARLPLGPLNFIGSILPQSVTMGSMFWTWIVALSAGQAIVNRELHPLIRLALAAVACAGLAISVTQLQAWVSGWAPALLSVFMILLVRFPVQTLIVVPALALTAVLGAGFMMDFATVGDNLYSLETRFAAIKALMPILSENPLLGLGPANYYYYTPLFPIESWYVSYNSHSTYLDLIAQAGLVGLFCFFWFAWSVLYAAWNLKSKPSSGFEKAYTISVIAGVVATLAAGALGDWILPFVYNTGLQGYRTSILPWIFIGGLIALERRVASRSVSCPS